MKYLKLLGIIEVSLLCVLLFSIVMFNDKMDIILALVLLFLGKIYYRHVLGKLAAIIGGTILFVMIVSNPVFLIMLLIALVLCLLAWQQLKHKLQFNFKKNKQFIMVQTEEPNTQKYGEVRRRNWWNSENNLSNIYEWDDIHLTVWVGDTIIDLGNTVLPEGTSVIVINKLFGDIRIIAPLGIGLELSHNTLYGHVLFENQDYSLKNEALKVYSDNYTTAVRKVKIITTNYFGNLEVIRL